MSSSNDDLIDTIRSLIGMAGGEAPETLSPRDRLAFAFAQDCAEYGSVPIYRAYEYATSGPDDEELSSLDQYEPTVGVWHDGTGGWDESYLIVDGLLLADGIEVCRRLYREFGVDGCPTYAQCNRVARQVRAGVNGLTTRQHPHGRTVSGGTDAERFAFAWAVAAGSEAQVGGDWSVADDDGERLCIDGEWPEGTSYGRWFDRLVEQYGALVED